MNKQTLREKIIALLESRGSLYLGDIIKELSMSPRTGFECIHEMKKEGILKTQPDSPKLTLS